MPISAGEESGWQNDCRASRRTAGVSRERPHATCWGAAECGAAAVFVVLTAVLFAVSRYSYVVFHTLVEMFAVLVAMGAFGVAWYSRRWIGATFLLMLGVGYLFVGLTDLLHLLTYKGLGILAGVTVDTPTQFWIAGRVLEAVAFVIAVAWPLARFPVRRTVAGFGLAMAAIVGAVVTGTFPVTYVDGQGLTAFKVAAEYVVVAGYLAAFAVLHRTSGSFDPEVRRLLMGSLAVKVAAELCFTLYVDVYGLSNFVGHILKIVSYYLFLRAIVETGLTRPQALVFGAIEREKALAEAVRDHASTLDAVLDASPDPVAMFDRDGRFRFVSRAAETFFGRPADRLSGRTWREAGLSDATMIPIEALCRRVLESGSLITEECRVPTPRGNCCLEVQVAPVRGSGGEASAVVTVIRDISRRKCMEEKLQASLDDNRVLMMEVHHRVKNNLQIVSSLLQMQGWRVADPDIRGHFDEACGRILSLAKVHEMLCKEENVAAVDFVRYLRVLCDELFQTYGVRDDWVSLGFDAGSLALPLDKAVPLALIVHELVTDAVKHAFTVRGGKLRLSVSDEDGQGVLTVTADGAVDGSMLEASGGSLGMRMVSVLVRQIHGTLTETHEGASGVTVRFPLAEPAPREVAADAPAGR